MKNIVLLGYRCTGKSSAGMKIAERLRMRFFDTDHLIVEQSRMSIGELVNEGGWSLFRRKEKNVIRKLASTVGSVIATGGGAFEDPENREHLKRNGLFIWLHADAKTVIRRMESDQKSAHQRPSLSADDVYTEVVTTMGKREPEYRRIADFTIDTSTKSIESVVDEICTFVENSNKKD
ncbi:MAG: shikimate kinase [Deltaproteobacteria bacterium]|nr:shikimate kinase [Deltaproteobacteria bacterium]